MHALKLADPVLFLSTLSLRRATGKVRVVEPGLVFLSTLSLRRATKYLAILGNAVAISIHALLAESDFGCFGRFAVDSAYFYPRSPCGERLRKSDDKC